MNIHDALFFMQFFIIIGILLYKMYNVMNLGQTYSMKAVWILFIGFFLAYALGMVILLLNPEKLIYVALFKLSTWFIVLNVGFLIIEIFYYFSSRTMQRVQPYNARERLPYYAGQR